MRDQLATAIAARSQESSGAGRGVVVDTTVGPGPVDVVIAGRVVPAHLDTDMIVYAGETVQVSSSVSGLLSVAGVVSWRPTAGVATETVDDSVQVRCAHPEFGGCTVSCRMSGQITPGTPVAVVWTAAGPVAIPVNSAEPIQDPIVWDTDPGMPDTLTVPEPDVPEPSEVAVRPSWWTGESNTGNTTTSGLRLAPKQDVVLLYGIPSIEWDEFHVSLTIQRTSEGFSPSPITIKLTDTGSNGNTTVLGISAKTSPVSPGETIVFDLPQDMAQVLAAGAANSLSLSSEHPMFIESPAVNISSTLLTFTKES